MKSPFSAQQRAYIYVFSLVISAAATLVGPLSLALHWGQEWAALAVTLVGVLGTVTGTLAKANLPEPADNDTQAPQEAEQEDQPQTAAAPEVPASASVAVSVEPGTPIFASATTPDPR
ncbi:hypothetical protein [Propionibacterium freudenreichii]|uniref:hypothetical protein n=1 Tax=Propionibacterium freudenreichii TaxID=1744 RepID=UPI0021A44E10|nr:hypothetical protein [Propionibacterium freudenreichii]MCT2983692.1 hypothetical protein [Propionibacterium freudenreichii]